MSTPLQLLAKIQVQIDSIKKAKTLNGQDRQKLVLELVSSINELNTKSKLLTAIIVNQQPIELTSYQCFVLRLILITIQLFKHSSYDQRGTDVVLTCHLLLLIEYGERWKGLFTQKQTTTEQTIRTPLTNVLKWCKSTNWSEQQTPRLVSQILKLNKYHNSNKEVQSLYLTSINIASRSIVSSLPTPRIAAEMLHDAFFIEDPYSYANDFFTGNFCIGNNKETIILLNVEPKKNSATVLNYNNEEFPVQTTKTLVLHQLISQRKLSLTKILDKCAAFSNEIEKSIISSGFSTYQLANNFHAPPSYKNTLRIILHGNKNSLIKSISANSVEEQFILSSAQELSRSKLPCNDIGLAISMLGVNRLYPIVCSGFLQQSLLLNKEIACSIIYEKYRVFAESTYFISKRNQIKDPEYISFIARLLYLALITVPKAKFNAGKPKLNNVEVNSIAELFNYNNIAMWKKLTLMLARSWSLPKKYQVIIDNYFQYLTSDGKMAPDIYSETITASSMVLALTYSNKPLTSNYDQLHPIMFNLNPSSPII